MEKANILVDSILAINENLVQPFYDASDILVQFSNTNVACQLESQAIQLNIRTQTSAGLGDLIYTVLQFPFEGYFEAKQNPQINNQLWSAVLSLYKGWKQRKSMTCREAGYEFGRIYQAMISFEIPDQILYDLVDA
mmetsp:Transcript_12892/g.21812  ORF Transcript_12892/g.21812 Transcript_12892/m.21812 type:complete len:136 (-) Transcript_12892:40-447(-)